MADLEKTGLAQKFTLEEGSVTRTIEFSGLVSITRRPIRSLSPDTDVTEIDAGYATWWLDFLVGDRSSPHDSANKIRSVDFFSGVGGLTLGAQEAAAALGLGLEPLAAIDLDQEALLVYRRNFQTARILSTDADEMVRYRTRNTGDRIQSLTRPAMNGPLADLHGKVDLVLAGPPCQGHSSLNNHTRGNDERNRLYLTPVFAAIALDAPMIVIENVPGVVNDAGDVVKSAIRILQENGYHVDPDPVPLRADGLGWAQTRKRHFLVARRGAGPIALREIMAGLVQKPCPISWAIADIENEANEGTFRSVANLSEENIRRIAWLHENKQTTLAYEYRPEKHRQHASRKASYGRMTWHKPAPTITTGFQTPGRGRFVHPRQPRMMTPHEAARVQGFPDWFTFAAKPDGSDGKRTELAKWIGDAVPSILGYAACLAVLAPHAADVAKKAN